MDTEIEGRFCILEPIRWPFWYSLDDSVAVSVFSGRFGGRFGILGPIQYSYVPGQQWAGGKVHGPTVWTLEIGNYWALISLCFILNRTQSYKGSALFTNMIKIYLKIYNLQVIIERKPQYESGKRYILTSPYRSFNFQQLFFYDIFLRNAYFTSYRSSN